MAEEIDNIDEFSHTKWECDQCGKEHIKHNPPCNRCGGMSFTQAEVEIKQEYDRTLENVSSRVYPNSIPAKLTVTGGGLTLLSSVFPWMVYESSVQTLEYQLPDVFLPFVVLFGFMIFGVYLSAWKVRKYAAITGLGLVVLGLALYHIYDPAIWLDVDTIPRSNISYENGLYLAIAGGLTTTAGGLSNFFYN